MPNFFFLDSPKVTKIKYGIDISDIQVIINL